MKITAAAAAAAAPPPPPPPPPPPQPTTTSKTRKKENPKQLVSARTNSDGSNVDCVDAAYSRTKNPINGQSVVATDSTGSQIISKRRRTTGLKPAINGLRQRTGN